MQNVKSFSHSSSEFSERTENGSFVVIALNHVYRDKRPPVSTVFTVISKITASIHSGY